MMMTLWIIIAALQSIFIAYIWSNRDKYNQLIKFVFILLAIYGNIILLMYFGFIVRK